MIATYKASLDRDNRVNWLDAPPKFNFEKASVLVVFMDEKFPEPRPPLKPKINRTKVHPELKPIIPREKLLLFREMKESVEALNLAKKGGLKARFARELFNEI